MKISFEVKVSDCGKLVVAWYGRDAEGEYINGLAVLDSFQDFAEFAADVIKKL